MTVVAERLGAALSGRYAIERQLGEGGMATVYLARDLKHDRSVALKVLKPELAAVVGAERFLGEITTTANLQHPHILPLFDSGEADGFLFYVMPLVEGESLRERLGREHQLPVEDAVRVASQVAGALAYAHRHGVVHRDIKPANVLLHEGEALVADFGIALALGSAEGGRLTETGLSLGTPHYMSPEQATGDRTIGAATDIYALGCVLHEMLVGEPPYTGATPQAVLGKIITGEAEPVGTLRRSVPPNVEAVVARALEKVPADRFGTAEDFASALDDPAFRHGGAANSVGIPATRWRGLALLGWGVAAMLGLVAAWSLAAGTSEPERTVTRLSLAEPDGVEIAGGGHRGLTISPDGRTVVFADRLTGRLYRRELERGEAVAIGDVEGAWNPFFSPDGEWVGFFNESDSYLMKVRLDGSDAQRLAEVPPTGRSAGWGEDGWIVLHSTRLDEQLSRVRDSGGEIQGIPRDDDSTLLWIDLLPGGDAILASRRDGDGGVEVVAVRLDDGETLALFAGSTPRYVSPGYVVFARDDALWSVPFDAEVLDTTGDPKQVAPRVYVEETNAFALFGVREDLLVYHPGISDAGLRDVDPSWVDVGGAVESLGMPVDVYQYPRVSPDGRRIALVREDADGNRDIWIHDLVSGSSTPLTFHPADDFAPLWSRDGTWLVFASDRDGAGADLYRRAADGSGVVERMAVREGTQFPNDWTPEGDLILGSYEGSSWSLFTTSATPGDDLQPLLDAPFSDLNATISPDGEWIAYQSREFGGPFEIVVASWPELTGRRVVSTVEVGALTAYLPSWSGVGEGLWPLWSRDGDALFYRSLDHVLRVPVERTPQGETVFRAPESLFAMRQPGAGSMPTGYHLGPDGRVLVLPGAGVGRAATDFTVVLDWQGEPGAGPGGR